MSPTSTIALLFVVTTATGCTAFDDDYCNDEVAGAPSCSSPPDDDNNGAGTPTAALLPIQLGDQSGTTEWIATGGSANRRIQTANLERLSVFFRNASQSAQPNGDWLLTDVTAADTLRVTGTISGTTQTFSTNLPLRVAPVETVTLSTSGAYVRRNAGTPVFLALPDGVAPAGFIQLRSLANNRLIDISMSLDAETSMSIEQVDWDRLALPTTAGSYRVALAADSFARRVIDLDVVDHVDRLESSRPVGNKVCFHAITDEREVFAVWAIELDDAVVDANGANCVIVPASGTLVARAGGLELLVDLATR